MPDAAPATRRTTPAALLVLALAALTLALPVAPAQGASHAASRARASHARTTHAASHAKKAHAKASRAKTARALVAAVTRARTPSAGGKALLAAMRRLHVAVDTRDGRALVRDGDVARHAFLYDFELRGLAAARARGERVAVADLAARLDAAGLHRPGRKLTAAALARGLAAGARDAVRHPGAPGSLPGLVLRDLGLADSPRVDLAKLRGGDSLDPVQAELVLVGVAQMTYGRPGRPARRAAHRGARASSATGICTGVNEAKDLILSGGNDGLPGKLMKKVLLTILKKAKLTKQQQGKLKLAEEIVDGLHGAALALSVSVRGDPESAGPAHYSHSASEHNVLTLRVRVEMLDDYGDAVVKCGPLAGLKFPKKGGIPDVPMHWETTGLAKHGQVVCEAGCKRTDGDGVATLQVVLNGEAIPGYGLEQEDTGVADAIAEYQAAFGAGLGDASFWAQFATPKYGGVRWHVTWHKQPNLALRMSVAYDESYEDQHLGETPLPIMDGEGHVIGSYWETAGSGGKHFALAADLPLATIPTADGSSGWTGSGPLGWSGFGYEDAGEVQSCNDLLGPASVDERGSAPSPGQLDVDAVSKDPAATPGITAVLHLSRLPSYTQSEATTLAADHGTCFNGTRSERLDYEWFLSALDGAEGVVTPMLAPDPHASDTYRITGFLPGPPSGGGPGVYAYRELPFTDVDEWGREWGGRVRLELVATPAP